jgi:hypothetical protein
MSKCNIRAMSTPYEILVEIPLDEVKQVCDDYWAQNSKVIIARHNIKPKLSKGGEAKNAKEMAESRIGIMTLYRKPLSDLCQRLISKEVGNELLWIENINPSDYTDNYPTKFFSVFYKKPYLKFEKELNYSLTDPVASSLEDFKTSSVNEILFKHRSKEVSEVVTESSELVINVMREGEPTVTGHEVDFSDLEDPVKEKLLGKSVNCVVTMEDGTVVSVSEIREVSIPELSNELLALDGSLLTLEDFYKSIEDKYNEHCKNLRTSKAVDHIIEQIVMGSEYGPVPQGYINATVDLLVKEHVNAFDGDEMKAMSVLKVTSKEEMENIFIGEVMRYLASDLAFEAYARLQDMPEDSSKEDVINDILSSMKWETK